MIICIHIIVVILSNWGISWYNIEFEHITSLILAANLKKYMRKRFVFLEFVPSFEYSEEKRDLSPWAGWSIKASYLTRGNYFTSTKKSSQCIFDLIWSCNYSLTHQNHHQHVQVGGLLDNKGYGIGLPPSKIMIISTELILTI